MPSTPCVSWRGMSSTAISRGLIEAVQTHRRHRHGDRRHPRRSAVASLKRRGACDARPAAGGHPRRSAVASLKQSAALDRRAAQPGHPRRSAVASLKPELGDEIGSCGVTSSTAISRGLIEAGAHELVELTDRRSSTAISRGLIEAAGARIIAPLLAKSSTAISRGLIEAACRAQPSESAPASSTAISRGLIEAEANDGTAHPVGVVIHGDQPWPH